MTEKNKILVNPIEKSLDYSVDILLLFIIALLLIGIINKQYFTTTWNSRILSIIRRSNPGFDIYYDTI